MTQYYGGKKRLGKKIADVMLGYESSPDQPYFEPFVGMGSIISNIPAYTNVRDPKTGNIQTVHRTRYANDLHTDLIAMWMALQEGWVPPEEITPEAYEELRKEFRGLRLKTGLIDTSTSTWERCALRAYAGFGYAWNGCYFAKYVSKGKRRAFRSIQEIRDKMEDVIFLNQSYDEFEPEGMLIYCDPPYKTKSDMKNQYPGAGVFCLDTFWDIMRLWSRNNLVFISERTAPSDFVSVWNKSYTSNFKLNRFGGKDTFVPETFENLFVHQSICPILEQNALNKQMHSITL